MNNLKIEAGERFMVLRGNAQMEIVKIEGHTAVIKELATGRVFTYGIEALRRCAVERIEKEGT